MSKNDFNDFNEISAMIDTDAAILAAQRAAGIDPHAAEDALRNAPVLRKETTLIIFPRTGRGVRFVEVDGNAAVLASDLVDSMSPGISRYAIPGSTHRRSVRVQGRRETWHVESAITTTEGAKYVALHTGLPKADVTAMQAF